MKMNKKGFTLVEIITVLTLLGVLMILVISNIGGVNQNMQTNMYCSKVEAIEASAVLWGQSRRGEIHTVTGEAAQIGATPQQIINNIPNISRVSVGELALGNYIPADNDAGEVIDPRTNESMNNAMVYVFIRHNRVQAILREAYGNLGLGGPCQL